MEKYDVLIIGAGLGGLLCGNILGKEGYRVCVLEKNPRIGGCIQSFARDGVVFNTGFNYTEGLAPGQVLNRYFSYLGLMDKLDFRQLDIGGFDIISFAGTEGSFPLAQGHANFADTLAGYFPKEKDNLHRYVKLMEETVNAFPLYHLDGPGQEDKLDAVMSIGASQTIKNCINDPLLQNVLAGMSSLYAGNENTTPFYIHALINYSFISSAWRLVNGGTVLANALRANIKNCGGDVFTAHKVKRLDISPAGYSAAICENGNIIEAKKIVSSAHPWVTMQWLPENMARKSFRNRLASMKNTTGMFSLYCVLKKDSMLYQNRNYHHFSKPYAWMDEKGSWPSHAMVYTQATSKTGQYANGLTIMTYMDYSLVKRWENTQVGQRGQDYEDFKAARADELLRFVEKQFPGTTASISKIYTSTPLTYRDYTGTAEGASYGIDKDWANPLQSLLLPKAPVPNLYFTGQNLNVHGILGVTVGAVSTCAEFVGRDYLLNKIRKH
jgi:all-trans-retinol 13,14-reductase